MSHILFELLENSGFVRGQKLNREAIAKAKRGDLVDIAIQSAEILPTSSISVSGSVFSHTASLSLSGGLSPCSNIECRRAKVNELAQFAALYSDKVITNNGLYTSVDRLQEEGIDDAKQAFEDELVLLLALRPLIESGHILPITPAQNTCFHCLGKSTLPAGEVAKFEKAYQRFAEKFSGDAKVTLQWSKSEPVVIQIEGHEDLVEHGTTYRFLGNVGKLTRKQPKLAAKLKQHGQVVLSKSERKKWGIDVRFAHDFFDDIGFEMAVSQCLKTSVVTSRPLDIEILNDIVRSDELSRRNSIIQKHMTCLVPFLAGIPAGELLKLREAEADSFILFRQALGKAVEEYVKAKPGRMTERDAEAIYKQVIEPELARLNQKVKTAKSSIFKKSSAGVLGWAAAISAGFYFGFVESSVVAAAKALGLTKVAADMASGMLEKSGEDTIRHENMYFLWKVRHFSERK